MLCTPLPSSPQLPPAQLHLRSGTVCGANPVLLHGGRGLRLGTLCGHPVLGTQCWAHCLAQPPANTLVGAPSLARQLWRPDRPSSPALHQTGPTPPARLQAEGPRCDEVPCPLKCHFRAGRSTPASPCFIRLVNVRAFTVRAHVSNRWLRSQLARNPAPSSGPGRQASRSTHSVILPV